MIVRAAFLQGEAVHGPSGFAPGASHSICYLLIHLTNCKPFFLSEIFESLFANSVGVAALVFPSATLLPVNCNFLTQVRAIK